uniref:Uncharacterized protein n=1 Tax=Oryza brachyantha TaxID=4533 RepID=J3N3M6_ORYBR
MVSPLRPSRFYQYPATVVQSSLSEKCYKPGALESQCRFCEQSRCAANPATSSNEDTADADSSLCSCLIAISITPSNNWSANFLGIPKDYEQAKTLFHIVNNYQCGGLTFVLMSVWTVETI